MMVWLPYDSVAEVTTRLGILPEVVQFDVLADNRLPISGGEVVEWVALPNYSAGKVVAQMNWDELPQLEWLQLGSAGFEHIIDQVPSRIGVCNAAGVHDAGTAELAIGLALAALRRIDRYAVDRLSETFAPVYTDSLADKRVLIIGCGHVGSAIERRLMGFEVASITRVARTSRTDPQVHAVADLPDLVGQADVIFLSLPGSDSTQKIINADLLSRMADGTLVVNVGRGPLIDTDALLAEQGRIRAALDVTDPEPLPPGHPLWQAEHITWTPHVGGRNRSYETRYAALIRAQLGRLVSREPLLNIVRSPQ